MCDEPKIHDNGCALLRVGKPKRRKCRMALFYKACNIESTLTCYLRITAPILFYGWKRSLQVYKRDTNSKMKSKFVGILPAPRAVSLCLLKRKCIITHRVNNYINKPTRSTFCMYLFYNFCTTLHVSNDHFVHHQEFMIYCILQLCTNRANVSTDTFINE